MRTVLSLIVAVMCSLAATAQETSLRATVKHLGFKSEDADFPLLSRNPQEAVRLLIAELHPVTVVHIAGYKQGRFPRTLHVVWVIRALRYLTGGMDFCAPSNDVDYGEGVQWQHFTSDGHACYHFFDTWMSRDSLFFAPPDTQVAVIRQWKDWYRKNGATFEYKTARSIDDWYF